MVARNVPRGVISWDYQRTSAVLKALFSPDPSALATFEKAFARYLGVRHAIGVSSGKAALALILRNCGTCPGDRVVLSSYNVPEVPAVIKALGLSMGFADIDPETFNLDPKAAQNAIDRKTKVLIVTHLYGNPADLSSLDDLAKEKRLVLIEDCAQALGARFYGRPVGTFGKAAIFSFGLMKNLNTLRGGMVVTDDDEMASRIRQDLSKRKASGAADTVKDLLLAVFLAVLTQKKVFSAAAFPAIRAVETFLPDLTWKLAKMRPKSWERGDIDLDALVGRMGLAQAACGIVGLSRVEDDTRSRQRIAELYKAYLSENEEIGMQKALPGSEPAWTQFVIRVRNRDLVRSRLLRKGIDTTKGYLCACDRLEAFLASDAKPCKNAFALEQDHLYLPLFAGLDDATARYIASSVLEVL